METPTRKLTLEERFNMFLNAACDYAIFFMAADGSITEWSAGAERILGYSEKEAIGLNGRTIFTAEDRARGVPEQEMERARREDQANDERWHVRKDGSSLFAIGRLVALKDAAGNLYGFAKILRDATPHKLLERALQASDEQFRATFAQAPLGMVLSDLRGRIQQVNAAFGAMTGHTAEALLGRELVTLIPESNREATRVQVDDLLTGRRASVVIEQQLSRADGSQVWVQNSKALLRDAEGAPLSFIDLFQDISVLKLSAEELERRVAHRTAAVEEKTKQMESFCYTVAHDLRAPLRAISGYAELLRVEFSEGLTDEAREYLQRIASSSNRLGRLITDLLGYTRAQQVPLSLEKVDLTAMAQQVSEQVKREHPGEDFALDVLVPLGVVQADRVTLEHVFHNLISNAVKFRRANVRLELRIHAERKDRRLRVWFDDNGVGLDPRTKHRAFGMFERLHPELKIPGTGVGLAIVATAMERFGGASGVEVNQPAGSRFWIEFPA